MLLSISLRRIWSAHSSSRPDSRSLGDIWGITRVEMWADSINYGIIQHTGCLSHIPGFAVRARPYTKFDVKTRRKKCMSQDTIGQIRRWISEQELDAFLVTQPQNRSYLSGWLNDDTEGAGMLLVGMQ